MRAQKQLLRVLQEREIVPLGATSPRKVDLRFYSATNLDMEQAIREGRFLRELYTRITAARLHVPPLRERREEIPISSDSSSTSSSRRHAPFGLFRPCTLHAAVCEKLIAAEWTELNVRGLRNALSQALIELGDEDRLTLDHFPDRVGGPLGAPTMPTPGQPAFPPTDGTAASTRPSSRSLTPKRQQDLVRLLSAIEAHGGVRAAAAALGSDRREAYRLLDDAGLDTEGRSKGE